MKLPSTRLPVELAPILGNSIFENGPAPPLLSTTPPGINLGDNNGTSPPVNVAHVGPNHLQDAPEVTSVVASGSGTAIAVTLSSFPNQVFRIEFFADANAGIQGRKFLGAGTLTTDSSGSGTLTITVPTPLSALVGQRVTATATNESTGDTSEFGAGHFVTGT